MFSLIVVLLDDVAVLLAVLLVSVIGLVLGASEEVEAGDALALHE